MSVNTMDFNQVSTVLAEIHKQATGEEVLAPVNTSEFTTVAQKTILNGLDPVMGAITQLVSKTIFSIRPYNAKFGGLRVDSQRWGAITRKLSIADKPFADDARFELVEGESVDMYKVNKPNILQTNFYGTNVWQKDYTIFRDQLNNAFRGPEEFGDFMAMVTGNALDMITQANEELAKATLANFIGGKVAADNGVIHLLTEYNTETGEKFTKEDVMKPANFPAFVQWVYGRVENLCRMMTERTSLYQINVTGKEINRHTPMQRQKVYLNANVLSYISSRVLADKYHDNFVKFAETEAVNYWQAPDSPYSINVQPVYLNTNGTLITGKAGQVDDIFGVIFDEEALGYTVMEEYSATTPFNAAGGYWNVFHHMTRRFWNDFTEKGIILKID